MSADDKPLRRRTANVPTVQRITVALVPKVAEDLQRLQARTNMSKMDIVNRAITLYEFIDEQRHAGCDLLIRNTKTGETRLVWHR